MTTLLPKFKVMTAVAAMTFMCFGAAYAEEITINDGTANSNASPIHTYYWDRQNRSQIIYPAELLTDLNGKTVTQIKFYIMRAGTLHNENVTVSAGTSEDSYFTVTNAFLNSDDFAEIYSGVVDFTAQSTEWTLTLTSPLVYNGGNLVLNFVNSKGNSPQTYFYGVTTTNPNTLYKRSGMASANFLPKTTFTYSSGDIAVASVSPTNIDFGTLLAGEGSETRNITIRNAGSIPFSGTVTAPGESEFSVAVTSIPEIANGESVEIPVTYTPATEGDHTATIAIDLGDAGTYNVALAGSAYVMPQGTRTFFNATDYNTALPEGWTPYVEELAKADNSLVDFTTDYTLFPTAYRFDSMTVDGSPAIAWNHGNPAPNTDLYERYYYMISPASQGCVWLRAMTLESELVGPFIRAYSATAQSDGSFVLGEEIEITWDGTLGNETWTGGTFSVEAGTRVALFMKYAAIASMTDAESMSVGIDAVPQSRTLTGTYTIYDLSGKIVGTGTFGNEGTTREAVEGLGAGCYIIRTAATAVKILKR